MWGCQGREEVDCERLYNDWCDGFVWWKGGNLLLIRGGMLCGLKKNSNTIGLMRYIGVGGEGDGVWICYDAVVVL